MFCLLDAFASTVVLTFLDSVLQGLYKVGVRIRGTLGDIDPLNKFPFKRATSRVQKGPL